MAPTLPSSLSPHICIVASPDLQELLTNASLPPLSQILQSFAPLSQGASFVWYCSVSLRANQNLSFACIYPRQKFNPECIIRTCASPTRPHAILPPLTLHIVHPRITPHVTRYAKSVTTRTTNLTSVPHASFALRFSELPDVEDAAHEDEEQRAGRTMDWIGTRVGARAARWVELVEQQQQAAAQEQGASVPPLPARTPWWDEVKRCVEGDQVPNRFEGWNHPVARTCLHSV